MPIVVKIQPTSTPVQLCDAKAQIGLIQEDSTHDLLVSGYVAAATRSTEEYTGAKWMTQTVQVTWDSFETDSDCNQLDIGLYPIEGIVTLVYDAADGSEVEMAEGVDYWANLEGMYPTIAPVGEWPMVEAGKPGAVRLTLVAGVADPAFVPDDVGQAILIRAKEMYAQRGESVTGSTVSATELTVKELLRPHRRIDL
mgnify:CR=1 FL=1